MGSSALGLCLAASLYLILAGLAPDGLATFVVLTNPFVPWLWIGALLLLSGGILAWRPDTAREMPVSQSTER